MRTNIFILCLTFGVLGCATNIDGARYSSIEPAFELFNFFDGSVKAWGLVQNSSGEVIQRFDVDIKGTVNGDRMILDESFSYSIGDGKKKRTWEIQKLPSGRFIGSANDTLGDGTGVSFGNAFKWVYRMNIPVGNEIYEVTFKDWFWAIDEKYVFNRSYIQKFGFDVAEVTIFMARQ